MRKELLHTLMAHKQVSESLGVKSDLADDNYRSLFHKQFASLKVENEDFVSKLSKYDSLVVVKAISTYVDDGDEYSHDYMICAIGDLDEMIVESVSNLNISAKPIISDNGAVIYCESKDLDRLKNNLRDLIASNDVSELLTPLEQDDRHEGVSRIEVFFDVQGLGVDERPYVGMVAEVDARRMLKESQSLSVGGQSLK
ncbi:hypothetical protein ACI2KR_08160 [Pseudomonas luteola]